MNKLDSTTFAFNQLPLELKREVLSHLDFSNLVRFEQVSKSAQFILSGLHCDFSQGYLTVKMPEKNNKGFQGSTDHLSFKEAKEIEWLKTNINDVYDDIKYYNVLERVLVISSFIFITNTITSAVLPPIIDMCVAPFIATELLAVPNFIGFYVCAERLGCIIANSQKRNKKLSDVALKMPQDSFKLLSNEVQNYLKRR